MSWTRHGRLLVVGGGCAYLLCVLDSTWNLRPSQRGDSYKVDDSGATSDSASIAITSCKNILRLLVGSRCCGNP